ncbi:nickel-responsive transcriptional regulator NikR [Desulfohalobium retbaense]|uniref:Putative nickel-responsive regulator n=1 Tax=Desulfohalobium retbaense (strain ATCC 49708 / DSM 5692 / JCM 16813 / HR100) TaxID=485915 RepID=C8WZN7_DESRD|nr:nickel-responsive transcriptional regulator NikR [Desulfohalobium retbaense]ACV67512.1 transcriptional regulator NikR, CopG family [Desulfohalobium retbaense DSM 5692]
MNKAVRVAITLDPTLLNKFDELCAKQSYQNRSEAIRDLIRNSLVQQEWREEETGESVGTLTLVYDHHHSDLAQRMTEIQHEALDIIVTSLHLHIDAHNCMEVLILRGPNTLIRDTAQRIISTRGVKHGKLTLSTTGKDLV